MNWWILGGAGIVLIAIGGALQRFGRRQSTRRGMKQFARDPAAMARVDKVFKQREEMLARAEQMSDEEIALAVEGLFGADSNLRGTLVQVIEKIGVRAEKPLLKALADPRCDPSENRENWRDQPVFETIGRLLAEIGSAPALPRMAALLESGNKDAQKIAALCVASVGSDTAAAPTINALADPEESVRSYAMWGSRMAVKSGRATPAFRNSVFEPLARIATGESGYSAFADREAASTLVALQSSRAIEVLKSDRAIRFDNPLLKDVLKTLNESRIELDGKTLDALLDESARVNKYPWHYVREECLRMLVRIDPTRAVQKLESALRSEDKDARNSAAGILCEKEGLADAHCLPFSLDSNSLPRPVAFVLLAWKFQTEVNNGGISQFFFNPAGNEWPMTIEALEAIGAKKCVEILRNAKLFFGATGPSTNRDKRIKQYASVSDKREKTLDTLSSHFYDDEDCLDVLITRYMIQHKSLFEEAIRQHVAKPSGE